MTESDATVLDQNTIDTLIEEEKVSIESENILSTLSRSHSISKEKAKSPKKRRKRMKRCNWMDIFLPFKSQNIFMLTGHILAEIRLDEENFWKFNVEKIVKEKDYYYVQAYSLENLTEFQPLIHQMQHSQCQEVYDQSQDLISYYSIIKAQQTLLKDIRKQVNFQELHSLEEQRSKFKLEYIQKNIINKQNPEDFYIVGNIVADIDNGYSNVKNMYMSKAYLNLIGITETQFESSYFRSYCLFFNIPPKSRRQFFGSILKGYVAGDTYHNQIIKDFWIQTVEQVNIYCDMIFKFIEIPYPSELRYSPIIENLHKSMDNVIITTLQIQDYHLKNILNIRSGGQINNNLIDFDYYMYSSIFLDKFYQKEFNPFNSLKTQQSEEEEENDKNRCSYRLLK